MEEDKLKKIEEDNRKGEEEIKKKQEELKEEMKKRGIEAVIRTEIKKFGKSAHIIIPKQFLNKKAVVLVVNEQKLFKK